MVFGLEEVMYDIEYSCMFDWFSLDMFGKVFYVCYLKWINFVDLVVGEGCI